MDINLHENAEKALRMVREAKVLSFDTEASGVNWRLHSPIGYVFYAGPESDGVYVPVRHGGGGNLPCPNGGDRPLTDAHDRLDGVHSFELALAEAFEYRNANNVGRTVGHNVLFDCLMSANAGVMLGRNLTCTLNNEALIDEYTKSFSLEAIAENYKVTAKKGDELYQHLARLFGCKPDRNSMGHYWRTSGTDPLAYDYAVGDGITTYEVYEKQTQILRREELGQVWQLENDVIWTLFRMQRKGIKVDTGYLEYVIEHLNKRVDEAYEALPVGFNPRSAKQVKDYVSQYATDWPTTEKGNPSFTEKWLKSFPEGHNIINVRKMTNLVNSFARPLLEEHTFNGRVNAQLHQNRGDSHGTVSGRLSCSGPNLQQVPKHDKELAILFRKAFVADEGMRLTEADYSQCEPRMFAHYSKDQNLVEGYSANPPKDMHSVVAEMLQVDRGTTAKRMNMGLLTGMGLNSFVGHMGMPADEVKDLWNQWWDLFPGIKQFQEQAKQVMLRRGYVKTLLKRRGRMESRRFAYKAVSRIIQGGNADIMKYKLVEIDKLFEQHGDTAQLLMTVHDSFLWQVPIGPEGDELERKALEIMVDVQSEPFNLNIPFVADRDTGANWAEASFGAENV